MIPIHSSRLRCNLYGTVLNALASQGWLSGGLLRGLIGHTTRYSRPSTAASELPKAIAAFCRNNSPFINTRFTVQPVGYPARLGFLFALHFLTHSPVSFWHRPVDARHGSPLVRRCVGRAFLFAFITPSGENRTCPPRPSHGPKTLRGFRVMRRVSFVAFIGASIRIGRSVLRCWHRPSPSLSIAVDGLFIAVARLVLPRGTTLG